MPREKSKGFDEDTMDDMQGMISKWVSIPFSICVVLVAGSCLNLIPYFLDLKGKLGFNVVDQEFIRWGVLGGYYGGILSGPIVDIVGTTVSFVLSAIISCGGFIALAYYTDSGTVSQFNAIVIISLIVAVSFASSIATIASISTVIKNFSRNVGSMIAAVMMSYFFIAQYFDSCIRHGYFEGVELRKSMIVSGVAQFIIYILAAFIIHENEISPVLKKASNMTDRFGIFLYAIIAGGFVAAIYFTCVIAENWKLGIFFMLILILINFVVLGFAIQMLLGRIKGADTSNVGDERHVPKKHIGQMLCEFEYYCLLIGTFIVIGSGTTFYFEAESVGVALGKEDAGKQVHKLFWISEGIAILGGGIFAALFVKLINGYLFAALAAFAATVGFALVFLAASYGSFWFWLSSFFVGAAVGGWWVIVPQIILDDHGPRNFETLWGFTLTFNFLGMFAFERFFMWIDEKTEPKSTGSCVGHACYLAPYVVSAVLCLIAGVLALIGYMNDSGTGGSDEDNRSLKNNDANAKGGRKTRESKSSNSGKRSKSRSKSKDKR